jgi:D-glycero-alpha-D-manno-heptose-7-phosphate kinase
VKISSSGSVRVDLLGGTLDLNPINLVLPNVVTLNLATSLQARVEIESLESDEIVIHSRDYDSTRTFRKEDLTPEKLASGYFEELSFVVEIINLFIFSGGLKITMESDAPTGSGLGGSSAMGVTLYKALAEYTSVALDREEAIKIVNGLEGKILDSGPAGYQDYYPALYGGVLSLVPKPGRVEVDQLYSEELSDFLTKHVTLVYSGESRLSGINNWEVYKKFFDKNEATRKGLTGIAEVSWKAYQALKDQEFEQLPALMATEGKLRDELFPGIVSDGMENLYNKIKASVPNLGMKVCGAGGGGCFLLIHEEGQSDKVEALVSEGGMTVLPFEILPPL